MTKKEEWDRLRWAIDALLKRDYTLEEIAEDLEGWV